MIDTSELLMVLGAIVIFSVAVLNINRGVARNGTLLMESELEYTAVSLGQKIIDEARTKAFDEATVTYSPSNVPAAFTRSNRFGGANDGESFAQFDDFDDYHGLSLQDTTAHGIYTISASVAYVTENNPDTPAGGKTSFKRLDVSVSSDFLSNTITLSYLKPY